MSDLISRLSRLDTCAVSDAMDRAGLKGVAGDLRQLSTTRRIVGKAITVKLGPDDGRPSKRHLCTAAVEASGPGHIIIIEHNGRTDAAGWGGILSLAASERLVEGVIIDGACRDLDESRAFNLPVYGKASTPATARGRVLEYDWNVPVDICGISVKPDDLIIADASGVVIVPAVQAEQIITTAETIAKREKLMADDVRAGKPVSAVMGTNYENMLKDL